MMRCIYKPLHTDLYTFILNCSCIVWKQGSACTQAELANGLGGITKSSSGHLRIITLFHSEPCCNWLLLNGEFGVTHCQQQPLWNLLSPRRKGVELALHTQYVQTLMEKRCTAGHNLSITQCHVCAWGKPEELVELHRSVGDCKRNATMFSEDYCPSILLLSWSSYYALFSEDYCPSLLLLVWPLG